MPAPRIEHKIVGKHHVFTSPDVPGLYVAHADYETARQNVDSAIQTLARMRERQAEREHVDRRIAARA